MAKRGYKLQEFVAHSANVNCLRIGKKACRLFITGGDDHKVNLWAIGKPTSLMSLCGHTSAVESVAFDAAEVMVLGGASAGAIKLWDLEEAKMVRTLTGHRSNCTAVEFHPFGEFFASGSSDTHLRIWDIRKKGSIHTYKGHTHGISTIRFTPDGRWVVSGGYDNVVKVWDLTAGKLLHDFKFHEGHIRSIDFHPLEFLLATGSADRTVKFWDLETFELIGSTRPEATGVRAITFHSDGRTLFSGLDDSLKVYSWEPVVRHDSIDIGWSTLGDLCINEGKLLGCSYYQNSVGVWVADISLIEPYAVGFIPEQIQCTEKKFDHHGSLSADKVGTHMKSTPNICCMSPDSETQVKNIYVDSTGGKPVASQRIDPLNSPKVALPVKSAETTNLSTEKQSPSMGLHGKLNGQVLDKSLVVPSIVPKESPRGKDSSNSGKESITFSRTKPGMLLRPAHSRRPSNNKIDAERLAEVDESGTINSKSEFDNARDQNFQSLPVSEDGARKYIEEKDSNIRSLTEKVDKILSPQTPTSQRNCDDSLNGSKGIKFVNGVAVVPGRTRSLVERFERRERVDSSEDQATCITDCVITESDRTPTPHVVPESDKTPTPHVVPESDKTSTPSVVPKSNKRPTPHVPHESDKTPTLHVIPESDKRLTTHVKCESDETPTLHVIPESDKRLAPHAICESDKTPTTTTHVIHESDNVPNTQFIRESDRSPTPYSVPESDKASTPYVIPKSKERPTPHVTHESDKTPTLHVVPESDKRLTSLVKRESDKTPTLHVIPESNKRLTPHAIRELDKTPTTTTRVIHESDNAPYTHFIRESDRTPKSNVIRESDKIPTNLVISKSDKTPTTRVIRVSNKTPSTRIIRESNKTYTSHVIPESDKILTALREEPQISGRDLTSSSDSDVIENLLRTHDVFLSTLRSRFTKLQVVRHFWERNDLKGAINALRKLPDQSVQADVISILMEKMDILTLDLFSCLLPVLLGLLDSKMERHASISLEMLLKLVAVFGPVVCSTISAPPVVGVDLQAEQRRECCNQCFLHLQKIQKILPALTRRGGLLAKCAHELNLVLQQS
ncbi:WD40 domain-containing protein/Katanin_con80 domain-containing protein [Cephalotus follicularis]|uniref:Katanin p80 WD40 repeat-containing subunit B1 homolog n=1 Tax=Cephalotus follicularis TaxID=3775 RepID=A0A1Q3AUA4_CEPFO|nr:WD40 domain-containing protein/Katanin_con80 domain-containing protein [Cephalotus follicularis]